MMRQYLHMITHMCTQRHRHRHRHRHTSYCVCVCVCVCVFVYACVRVPRSVKQLYCDSKYACIHICSILYRLHSLLTLKGDIHVILHLRTCTYTL